MLLSPSQPVYEKLINLISRFISLVAVRLPDDVIPALASASRLENSPHARLVYEAMFRNLEVAARKNVPLCQDTGVLEFFIGLGNGFPHAGDLLEAVREAVVRTTGEGFLRPNVVDPATGRNTGDNTGLGHPWVEVELLPGVDYVDLRLYMAGGGSSRPGSARVLDPALGLEGVAEFVLNTIAEYGPPACPPLVVGVGLGPTVEIAALLSKKALLRTLGLRNPNPRIAMLEERLVEAINELRIGPQGLGGRVTALAVHVEYAGRHPATLAVGVSTACWALRKGWLRVFPNLSHQVLTHGGAILE
ncbi:MAG: fumarate hydratase [Zestosphaera sp.]